MIWLLLKFECARKRDCICLLDGNGKTLKDVIGLEWITRDSSCASANFLGQLNGLSIPRIIPYYYYYYYYYRLYRVIQNAAVRQDILSCATSRPERR